jgi:hypothetical protein
LLIASTYGDPFDPETQQPPHILARNLDGASDIQAQLDRWVEAWHSPEDLTSDQALRRAFVDVGDSLTKALGHKHSVFDSQVSYFPVYDKDGKIIGHDASGFLSVDDRYLFKKTTTKPEIGIYGCVVLGVRKA